MPAYLYRCDTLDVLHNYRITVCHCVTFYKTVLVIILNEVTLGILLVTLYLTFMNNIFPATNLSVQLIFNVVS